VVRSIFYRCFIGVVSLIPMATYTPGLNIGDIRGSIGNISFGKSHYGLTIFTKPRQIRRFSNRSCTQKSYFSYFSYYWKNELTISEKQAWTNYSRTLNYFNSLGEKIILTGQNCFIMHQSAYRLVGLSVIKNPPTVPGSAKKLIFSQTTTIVSSTQKLMFAGATFDNWDSADNGGKVAFFLTPPYQDSEIYYIRKWRCCGFSTIAYPNMSPNNLDCPFKTSIGLKHTIKGIYVDTYNRISQIGYQKILVY